MAANFSSPEGTDKAHRSDVGPFSFAFPEVPNAYHPSGSVSALSVVMMFASATIAGLVGGFLTGIITTISWLTASNIAQGSSEFISLLAGGLYVALIRLGLPTVIGFLIAYVGCSRRFKNRNAGWAAMAGSWGGLLAYGVLYGYMISPAGFLLPITNFLQIVVGAGGLAYGLVGEVEFCESCQLFMKRQVSYVPIHNERTLLSIFQKRDFSGARVQWSKIELADSSRCEIDLAYCEKCNDGFINIRTTQVQWKQDARAGDVQ